MIGRMMSDAGADLAHNSHTSRLIQTLSESSDSALDFPFSRGKRRTLDVGLQPLNGRGKMKAILL